MPTFAHYDDRGLEALEAIYSIALGVLGFCVDGHDHGDAWKEFHRQVLSDPDHAEALFKSAVLAFMEESKDANGGSWPKTVKHWQNVIRLSELERWDRMPAPTNEVLRG